MDYQITVPWWKRWYRFFLYLGGMLLFVYVFLPYLTRSFPILDQMSTYLDSNGIDPTRYYYTDVEQVAEAEHHLEIALNSND